MERDNNRKIKRSLEITHWKKKMLKKELRKHQRLYFLWFQKPPLSCVYATVSSPSRKRVFSNKDTRGHIGDIYVLSSIMIKNITCAGLVRYETQYYSNHVQVREIFPFGFFDSMEHLVIHLMDEAIVGGPETGIIKRKIRNIAKVEDARNFAQQSHRFSSGEAPLSIFVVPSRRLYEKSGRRKPLSDKDLHKAHTYILLNFNPYILEFDELVMTTNPNESILDLRDKYFVEWFEDRVMNKTPGGSAKHLEVIIEKPSRHAHFHRGYFLNGYKFHTQQYGEVCMTNNFVVCVRWETYNVEQDGPSTVVLFNCIIFDNKDSVIVNKNNLIDVKLNSRLQTDDPFCLASQAEQVFHTPYPSVTKVTKYKWAVIKTKSRGVFEVTETEMEENEIF
uniref:DUF4216 domain-containing protein n=1 Tax=Lactuca sativa TaxID=4236 RepID=A0A9R1XNT7_LACSA|nr:hypothetical protein LSAT_V11C400174740 [Lactuca sativa]